MMHRKPKQKIYLKGWRQHRGLTQEQLAARIGVDRTIISKIENARLGYSQALLEAVAEALSCSPADLLMRDPSQPESIWSIWDQIPATERERATQVLMAFAIDRKTG